MCDVTRAETLVDLEEWKGSIQKVAGEVPILILANKADLAGEAVLDEEGLQAFCDSWDCPYAFTSAKTGENVEESFHALATKVLEHLASRKAA